MGFMNSSLEISIFAFRPAGDLDDHVEDAIVLVSEEGDIVERRHDTAVALHEDSVLCVADDGSD